MNPPNPCRNAGAGRCSGVDPNPADPGLASWLAAQGDVDPRQVSAELDVGARRRAFVVDELVDAGFEGSQLVELTMQLTGVDGTEAQALIAARAELVYDASAGAAVPKRDLRLAENEILFRSVNERLAAGDGSGSPPHVLELVCECSDRECLNVLRIEAAEYEWLRQNPHRFAVLPGHEAPAVEDVVERHARFVVVEKHVETHHQVEAADTRP